MTAVRVNNRASKLTAVILVVAPKTTAKPGNDFGLLNIRECRSCCVYLLIVVAAVGISIVDLISIRGTGRKTFGPFQCRLSGEVS
jgi:hypothetical protein